MARTLPERGIVSAHLLTIDLDGASPIRDADRLLGTLLETFGRAGRQATFFVPKSRAASRPLVARIAAAGHEVAALTTSGTATPYSRDFRAELLTLRAALESAGSRRVGGHRSLSGLTDETDWAYDVLLDEGFEYDSSFIPIERAQGSSSAQTRGVHAERRWGGTLLEIPPATSELAPLPVLFGSVRSMRRMPLPLMRHAMKTRDRRGAPSLLRLKESELRPLTRAGAERGSSAETRTLARLGAMLDWGPFMSLGAALPDLLRSAPIVER